MPFKEKKSERTLFIQPSQNNGRPKGKGVWREEKSSTAKRDGGEGGKEKG